MFEIPIVREEGGKEREVFFRKKKEKDFQKKKSANVRNELEIHFTMSKYEGGVESSSSVLSCAALYICGVC